MRLKIGTLRENMKWSIYGERLGVCIFDLEVTRKYLIRALNFLAHLSYRGAIILFVTSDRYESQMARRFSSKDVCSLETTCCTWRRPPPPWATTPTLEGGKRAR